MVEPLLLHCQKKPFQYVRDFQSVIGREAKRQFAEQNGGALPDAVLACVGAVSYTHLEHNVIGVGYELTADGKDISAIYYLCLLYTSQNKLKKERTKFLHLKAYQMKFRYEGRSPDNSCLLYTSLMHRSRKEDRMASIILKGA